MPGEPGKTVHIERTGMRMAGRRKNGRDQQNRHMQPAGQPAFAHIMHGRTHRPQALPAACSLARQPHHPGRQMPAFHPQRQTGSLPASARHPQKPTLGGAQPRQPEKHAPCRSILIIAAIEHGHLAWQAVQQGEHLFARPLGREDQHRGRRLHPVRACPLAPAGEKGPQGEPLFPGPRRNACGDLLPVSHGGVWLPLVSDGRHDYGLIRARLPDGKSGKRGTQRPWQIRRR